MYELDVTILVIEGADTVVVECSTPRHEQAEEYAASEEQANA